MYNLLHLSLDKHLQQSLTSTETSQYHHLYQKLHQTLLKHNLHPTFQLLNKLHVQGLPQPSQSQLCVYYSKYCYQLKLCDWTYRLFNTHNPTKTIFLNFMVCFISTSNRLLSYHRLFLWFHLLSMYELSKENCMLLLLGMLNEKYIYLT